MKLGFWNRLALVIGVVVTLVVPSWMVLSLKDQHRKVMDSGYQACIAAASDNYEPNGLQACWQIWIEPTTPYGWDYWWALVGGAAIAVVIVYLVIAAGIFTAKWVWRGRNIPE